MQHRVHGGLRPPHEPLYVWFIAFIVQTGAQVVIPPKANRLEQRAYDENLYADRNKVERFFNRLKHYRRLATRYEKTARNFLAFWQLACAVMLTL